jgi:hypothetical protein
MKGGEVGDIEHLNFVGEQMTASPRNCCGERGAELTGFADLRSGAI